jgi:hypothetical protein
MVLTAIAGNNASSPSATTANGITILDIPTVVYATAALLPVRANTPTRRLTIEATYEL